MLASTIGTEPLQAGFLGSAQLGGRCNEAHIKGCGSVNNAPLALAPLLVLQAELCRVLQQHLRARPDAHSDIASATCILSAGKQLLQLHT